VSLTELSEAPDHSDGMTVNNDGGIEPAGATAPVNPSKLSKETLFTVLKRWFLTDAEFSGPWRIQAKSDFDFRAGEQWTDVDKALLNAQQRPHIVFNRALTILKAVAGMEINGRHEIQFLPSNNTVTAPNELLSAASKWMAAGCDGEDEESEAFDNCSTCGMGWTENRLCYEDDPAGLYEEESTNPLEMYWDYSCRKKNLKGARRMARAKEMVLSDAMQLFPGYTRGQLDAVWAEGGELDKAVKSIEQKRIRDTDSGSPFDAWDDSTKVLIVEMQWFEREVFYVIADEQTQTKVQISEEAYKRMETNAKALEEKLGHGIKVMPTSARMTRKVYKRAFLGSELLQSGDAPIKGSFSWACITGERDLNKGTWFGLIKIMRDPQMWANKWLSQTLHILNTTAKGGIIAEAEAFDDITEAEEKWAMPDTIVWAAAGALSGANPKIIPKPGGGLTQGYVDLMQFAITSIRDCTGINLELLGQKDINQPGILEAQRKQAGMTVLATLFDSLRRFRKQVGRMRLYFIQTYFSDGRLIRVVGPDGATALPLLRDKTFGEYDVVVDDTPTSPNQKEANWAIIQPLLAIFKEQLMQNPKVFAEMLEYSPLPAKLVEMIKNFVTEAENDPQKKAETEMAKKLVIAAQVASINKDQSTAEMQDAKAGATQATASYDLAMAQHMLANQEFDKLKAHLDVMKTAADARKADADARTSSAKAKTAHIDSHTKLIGALSDHQASKVDGAVKIGQLHNDTVAAHAGAIRDVAAAHKDHATAHRERVGAVVDAMQPVQTDETVNPPPEPVGAK
jgi:hypothetical protein